ncbi:MAG: sigma-70 family RNA polymerase sigma factor [Pseudomonadota bacterium]
MADREDFPDAADNRPDDSHLPDHAEAPAPRRKRKALLDRLYNAYFGTLQRNLRALYGNGPPDPIDIVQEAFAKLAERSNLEDIQYPERFLWVSARNLMITRLQSRQMKMSREKELARRIYHGGSDNLDPERVLLAQDELERVMQAIEEMPSRRREIFMLNRLEGLTPEAAGRAVGISRSSAVKHIAKAMAMIEAALASPSAEDDNAGGEA